MRMTLLLVLCINSLEIIWRNQTEELNNVSFMEFNIVFNNCKFMQHQNYEIPILSQISAKNVFSLQNLSELKCAGRRYILIRRSDWFSRDWWDTKSEIIFFNVRIMFQNNLYIISSWIHFSYSRSDLRFSVSGAVN